MDLAKAIVSPVALVALLLGLSMLFHAARRVKAGFRFSVVAFALLCLSTTRPFANYLVWSLEKRFRPLAVADVPHDTGYIVVLTDWDSDDPSLPYTSNIGCTSALRVLEAHRIFQASRQSKLIISGSNAGCKQMSTLLQLLGVKEENVVLDQGAANTWESARRVGRLVRKDRFVLVTSALHMPRSVMSFARLGLQPVPAPGDYRFGCFDRFPRSLHASLAYYLPNLEALSNVDHALYEYLGLAWYAVRH